MKVLHLSPTMPWPPNSGGRIGIWNHLRADSRFADVGLVTFTESEPSGVELGALHTVCSSVRVIRRPRSLDGVVGGARSLLSSLAMNLAKYRWPVFGKAVKEAMTQFNPDIVVAHHLHMAGYLMDIQDCVRILREHNVDSVLMARYAESLSNPAMASFARRQADQIRETETRLCPRIDRCLVITPDDDQMLKEIVPGVRTAIVPGGLDPADYAPVTPPGETDPLLVAATGSFGFRPTGEGMVDFVERAWPRIRSEVAGARLRIIGDCPEPLKRRFLKTAGVEVLGRVDSVRKHLDGVHFCIVPLNVGSGMRIRILEAMAYEIPIVSTVIGCEGIHVQDGRHLAIVESVEKMSTAILSLYKKPAQAGIMRREGKRLLQKLYSLDQVEALTSRIYRKALEEASVNQRAS